MTVTEVPVTTYQIYGQAKEALRHYSQGRYIDAFDAACCGCFIAYYAMLRIPDGVAIYHRISDIRAECRWKLRELLRKGGHLCP